MEHLVNLNLVTHYDIVESREISEDSIAGAKALEDIKKHGENSIYMFVGLSKVARKPYITYHFGNSGSINRHFARDYEMEQYVHKLVVQHKNIIRTK
jgi:hypothetical protein